MVDGGYYDDFIHETTPSICFDLMQGKTLS